MGEITRSFPCISRSIILKYIYYIEITPSLKSPVGKFEIIPRFDVNKRIICIALDKSKHTNFVSNLGLNSHNYRPKPLHPNAARPPLPVNHNSTPPNQRNLMIQSWVVDQKPSLTSSSLEELETIGRTEGYGSNVQIGEQSFYLMSTILLWVNILL